MNCLSSAIENEEKHAQTRLNHLGLLLSWSVRVSLQEDIHKKAEKNIVDTIKLNPLMKITGDNVDVYVRTSSLNRERRNKDLHLFASNIIFSRIATIDMPNTPPGTNVEQLKSEHLLMTGMEKAKFLSACSVLLARILCRIPAFENLKRQIPVHIPHEYSQKMSTRSEVFPLPIMFFNESKHEDCMGIMDSYENQLTRLFENAFD